MSALRPDEIRAWRLLIEANQQAGGVPLGEFDWPTVLTKVLDEYVQYADRVDDAYEQGKEVGRVNGAARLAEMRDELGRTQTAYDLAVKSYKFLDAQWRRDLAELDAAMRRVQDLEDAVLRGDADTTMLALVREQRDALDRPCGDGRCYCGGCVL